MSEALPYEGDIRVGSHELARQFLKHGHSVLWVGCTYHLIGLLLGLLGSSRHRHVADSWRSGPVECEPGLWVFYPISFLPYRNAPGFRNKTVLRHSLRLTVPRVSNVIESLGFASPDLLWLSQSPNSAALINMVHPHKVAYRISDRYHLFRGIPPTMVSAENELLRRADSIFVTARTVLDDLPETLLHRCQYLPNGVDIDHFRRPAASVHEPEEFRDVPHPRAIFIGTIGDWVDIDQIARLARSMKHVNFILIGPIKTEVGSLAPLGNVRILGPRRYSELPQYLHCSDVGIIPFLKSPRTDAVSSNKLFQYFAAGLPVVSTRLDEIEHLNSPARLADTDADFAYHLEQALLNGSDHEAYVSFAQANTWDTRFETVRQAIGI